MAKIPRSVGLFLCDQVIFERLTDKPSLIGCFTAMGVEQFPTGPQRFDVFTALTNGLGDVTLDLVGARLDTDEEVYVYSTELRFPDPLQVVNVRIKVRTCVFPEPGVYLFALFASGDEIANYRVRVYLREGVS